MTEVRDQNSQAILFKKSSREKLMESMMKDLIQLKKTVGELESKIRDSDPIDHPDE